MPRKKKTNLIQRGETREHIRWRVETRGRTEANEIKNRNGCFERETERVEVVEPARVDNLSFENRQRGKGRLGTAYLLL